MREVGSERRGRGRAADRVAHGAALGVENRFAFLPLFIGRRRRRCGLRLAPGIEVAARLGDDEQTHMRVLQAAELRALPAIDSGFLCQELDFIVLARDEIHFSEQVRRPEAMDHVIRGELDGHRFAGGNHDLVCGREGAVGSVLVADLPPPLLADDFDRHRRFALRVEFALRDEAQCRQGDHDEAGEDDGRADDEPGATLARRVDAQRIGTRRAAPNERGSQRRHGEHPDHGADSDEQPDDVGEMRGLRALRVKRRLPAGDEQASRQETHAHPAERTNGNWQRAPAQVCSCRKRAARGLADCERCQSRSARTRVKPGFL